MPLYKKDIKDRKDRRRGGGGGLMMLILNSIPPPSNSCQKKTHLKVKPSQTHSGDLNAHNVLWHSSISDSRGKALASKVNNSNCGTPNMDTCLLQMVSPLLPMSQSNQTLNNKYGLVHADCTFL
ncbi:hypothetical protein HELRODRAFT_175889 [Helobdella robusta]|uniref:Uncharacterized protein n=1 Tax=Helobdella robusta TaxID=6412 RepID=T1F9U4_HELRO|nr:hypothetical protein HELRODRAFT_175889 [Helobdella robusta]ESO00457.1 hypothetical protein HELRODRAFT_175889 [Helobdella robusta]